MKKYLLSTVLMFAVMQHAYAVFPEDFSDVVWLDTNVSSWPVTANLNVSVSSAFVTLDSSKKNVWRAAYNPILQNACCNANAWVFVKFDETRHPSIQTPKWYAVTWEWLKRGQSAKNRSAFEGGHTRRFPFVGGGVPTWQPKNGEIYGLMVSGFARYRIPANVQERSNIVFYKWGQGPVDASELLPEPDHVPLMPVLDMLLQDNSE